MAMIKYKDAGVDVKRGYAAVDKIKEAVKSTYTEEVLSGIGGFGGAYSIAGDDPEGNVLISGTDGVGTKLKLAFETDRHNTIGIDCVAMCVNDILCSGAKPLFFLDYIATNKIEPEKINEIVSGVAEGCKSAGAALLGGETAEMPGFYAEGEYDIAGFAVGMVKKKEIVDGKKIKEGDVILGLKSSGIHSNGYSLIRKLYNSKEYLTEINNQVLIDVLMAPTRIYVSSILNLLREIKPGGMAHITGGGLVENIPRIIPQNLSAVIKLGSWEWPEIFVDIQRRAQISQRDMLETFNCGIGFTIIVPPEDVKKAKEILAGKGEEVYEIGYISKEKGAEIWFE
jgi:phosphoribosylformylglycinamidine cyclo-ligase